MQRLSLVLVASMLCACAQQTTGVRHAHEIPAVLVNPKIRKQLLVEARFWQCGEVVGAYSIDDAGHAWATYFNNRTGEHVCDFFEGGSSCTDETWPCEE